MQYGHKARGDVAGRPVVYRAGHNPRGRPNLSREVYLKAARNAKQRYIAVDRIQPLAQWLARRYGSYRQAAIATGLNPTKLARWGRGSVSCVHPGGAAQLRGVVLAHRKRMAPWDQWDRDVLRRMMSLEERETEQKRQWREERAMYRKRGRAA